MARLSIEEWGAVKAPFCYLRVEAPSRWQSIHFDIIGKWLDANLSGWWYGGHHPSDDNRTITYVFQHEGDRTLFKLWISDDPFAREGGAIEITSIHTGEEQTLKVADAG